MSDTREAYAERSFPGPYLNHCVHCKLQFGGPKGYCCCRKCKDIQLAVIAKGTEMSQTETFDQAYMDWLLKPGESNNHLKDAFKAGAAWAAKTPAECAVIEAAQTMKRTGVTVQAVKAVFDAVAALEREKVEGGSDDDRG